MSLQHTLLLKFNAEASERSKEEILARLKKLPVLVSGVASHEVHSDLGLVKPGVNYDVSMISTFSTEKEFYCFSTHPDYVALISFVKPFLVSGGLVSVQVPKVLSHSEISVLTFRKRPYDWPLVMLYGYFIFSCVFIESKYCFGSGPMDKNDTRFMMRETFDFSEKYNPLFLLRPDWLRLATCFSAFGMLPFHFILFLSFIFGFNRVRPFAFVFAGVKLYVRSF